MVSYDQYRYLDDGLRISLTLAPFPFFNPRFLPAFHAKGAKIFKMTVEDLRAGLISGDLLKIFAPLRETKLRNACCAGLPVLWQIISRGDAEARRKGGDRLNPPRDSSGRILECRIGALSEARGAAILRRPQAALARC